MSEAVKHLVKLLKESELTIQERTFLVGAILDKLGGIPIRDIILVNAEGTLLVNDNQLEVDKAIQIREAAKSALNNQALKLIWDQVKYTAFKMGVSEGSSPEHMIFGRTAIWNGEQERTYLRILAGDQ